MNYRKYILFGSIGVLILMLLVFIINIQTNKVENKYLEKELVIKLRIDSLNSEIVKTKLIIDSLSKLTAIQEKVIEKKKIEIQYIKPKYDEKINHLTSLPADSISKFITDRYK